MPLSTEYKWFNINFLKLFKQPGTVDKFSPTDSGIPFHGCHGEFHGFPGLQLVRSRPMFPILPLDFAPLHSSSWCWIFSFRSSPVLTLWNPQMILATSGLVLIVLDLALRSLCSACVLQVSCSGLVPGWNSQHLTAWILFSRAETCPMLQEQGWGGCWIPRSLGMCTITPLHICALDKDKRGYLLLTTEHYREPPARLPDGPAASQCHSVVWHLTTNTWQTSICPVYQRALPSPQATLYLISNWGCSFT